MNVVIKIVLTIVAFIIATFLMGTINSITGSGSPGVLGLVIGAGLIAGVVAIWKYKPEKSESKDIYKLDKD